MFENVLYQQAFVNSIKNEIENLSLPQSLLFHGAPFSGKLTAAIELSRVLNCQNSGEWMCQCKNCILSKNMQNPYLLIAGSRYFSQEIKQSGDFLLKERSRASQYVFTRNIRKLTKRFSEEIWDKDDPKLKKVSTSLGKIDEIIYQVEPGETLPEDKKLQTIIKKLTTECDKIANEIPKGNIPISQIRNISSWVRRSVSGHKKVIIFERAELMQESSRNSLLKILEEPPQDTYFILISEKKSRILPTILSRVRAYSFKERSKEEQGEILNKLYNIKSEFSSIMEFFHSYSDIDDEETLNSVRVYYNSLYKLDSSFSDSLELKVDGELFDRFLRFLTDELRKDDLSLSKKEKINEFIRDKVLKHMYYNQSPTLLLETLFYECKGVINA